MCHLFTRSFDLALHDPMIISTISKGIFCCNFLRNGSLSARLDLKRKKTKDFDPVLFQHLKNLDRLSDLYWGGIQGDQISVRL